MFLEENLISSELDALGEIDFEGLEEGIQININAAGELVLIQEVGLSSTGTDFNPLPFEGTSTGELIFIRQ